MSNRVLRDASASKNVSPQFQNSHDRHLRQSHDQCDQQMTINISIKFLTLPVLPSQQQKPHRNGIWNKSSKICLLSRSCSSSHRAIPLKPPSLSIKIFIINVTSEREKRLKIQNTLFSVDLFLNFSIAFEIRDLWWVTPLFRGLFWLLEKVSESKNWWEFFFYENMICMKGVAVKG